MYIVFCVVPYADVTCIGYFRICAITKKRMKSRTIFVTLPKLFWIWVLSESLQS